MKNETKRMLAKLLGLNKSSDDNQMDKLKAAIKKMAKELGDDLDCEATVLEATPENMPEILKHLMRATDNSGAHITNVETLCSTICDRIVRLREALEVLSYTQPDDAEYLRQLPVRIGKLGFEYKILRSELKERGLLDWAYEYLGPKDQNEDDDD